MEEKHITKTSQTILVVDDQIANRYKLMQQLKEAKKGYELLSAPNGKVAFEVANKLAPDLIVTDWDMPHMNGVELIRALKSQENTEDIPILIVTGIYTSSKNLHLAMDAGAVDYIRKPVEKLELWARVSTTLALRHSLKVIEQKNEEITRQKNKELNNKAFDIYRTKQLFKKIKILAESKPEDTTMRQIVSIVNEAIEGLGDWYVFRQHFDQIHPDFVIQLRKKYPKLTNEDIKYCIFVRLHLSAKEVAYLLNIHVDSVHTHHYRIRKKLGLSKQVRFSDYITGFNIKHSYA